MKLSGLFTRAMAGAAMAAALVSAAMPPAAMAEGSYPGSGAQPVSRGGTGRAALGQNSLLFGNGASPVGFLSPASLPGRCVVSDGTIWAAQYCLVTGSVVGIDPVTVNIGSGVATVALTVDDNFDVIAHALALKSIPSGELLANGGAAAAEPTATTLAAYLDRVLGATDGGFAARLGGTWSQAFAGTGLLFAGAALNLQPAAAGMIGGVNSIAGVTHQFMTSIDTAGLPHLAQPGFGDLSGMLAPAQCPAGTSIAIGCLQGDGATLSIAAGVAGINLGHANTWNATQTFPNNSLTLQEFATLGANTVIGSVAGGTPAALSQAQLTAMVNPATAALPGLMPAFPNNATTFLRGDGSFAALNFAAIGGTVAGAQLPAPGVSTLGAVFSKSCASGGQFVQTINTDGTVNCVTPAGGGNVSNSGTPSANQIAVWTSPTIIQGESVAVALGSRATLPYVCNILTTTATTCANGNAGANNGVFTPPAGALWMRVRMVGGGSGGQGGGTSGALASSTAGSTSLSGTGASLIAAGGSSSNGSSSGIIGGGASGGNILNVAGGSGGSPNNAASGNAPSGGSSCLGGGGAGSLNAAGAGNAAANSGAGGGGGSATLGIANAGGSGGAAGGCVEHLIQSPSGTYTYAVGAGTAGGAGGTNGGPGGTGASGQIIIEVGFGS